MNLKESKEFMALKTEFMELKGTNRYLFKPSKLDEGSLTFFQSYSVYEMGGFRLALKELLEKQTEIIIFLEDNVILQDNVGIDILKERKIFKIIDYARNRMELIVAHREQFEREEKLKLQDNMDKIRASID